jgi:hypothetical protein
LGVMAFRELGETLIDGGQGLLAVHLGLARSEQIQVGSVKD